MTVLAQIGIDAEPDVGRKAWHVYVSRDPTELGELVMKLDPDADFAEIPVEEGDFHFRVLAVDSDGTEEDWKRSGGSKSITITGEEHVPTAISHGAGGRFTEFAWGVAADPAPQGDPPQRIQLIRGSSVSQGQLVGETPLEIGDLDGRRRSVSLSPSLAGRGAGGGSVTLFTRSVSDDGLTPSTAVTITAPHLDFPNMTPTVLGYVTPNTLSGFSSPLLTSGWTHSATHGVLFKALPTMASATTALGWGTYETDGSPSLLGDEVFGTYFVTSNTITSQELDLGSSEPFLLECYDEFERASASGPLDTERVDDLDQPYNAAANDDWNRKGVGPVWMGRMVATDGTSLRPVRPTRWQYRATDTSPVTAAAWVDYPGPIWINTRYVQARVHASDPVGSHQLRSQRLYVRAWQANNSRVVQQSGDFNSTTLLDLTAGGRLEIGVETGAPKIQINIGGTVYTTATLTSV